MPFDPVLRTDVIPDELLEETQTFTITPQTARVVAEGEFQQLLDTAIRVETTRTVTPGPSKNIIEVMDVINQTILDYEERTRVTEDAKVEIRYDKPDKSIKLECITIELIDRDPGMYGQGRPRENKVKNRRPILREVVDDPDNPGYKRAVLGYFYDNTLRLTCWARTAKTANARALWLENVMEEYTWFFVYSGINRFLYEGRRRNETFTVDGNTFYGRPVDYYVRTEKLRNVSQKILETICTNMTTRISRL